jgi:hypothetical protein
VASIFRLAHAHEGNRVEQDSQCDQGRSQSAVARLHDARPNGIGAAASGVQDPLSREKRGIPEAFLKVDSAARNINKI